MMANPPTDSRFVRHIHQFMRRLDKACLWTSIGFMLLMIACVTLQIVSRYVFDSPPAWTDELGRYAMIWSAMLGAPCAYYRRSDPAIFQWDPSTPGRKQLLRQLVETAAVTVFIAPILYYSPATLLRNAHRETETLGISSAYVLSAVPLGLSIILIYSLLRLQLRLCNSASAIENTGAKT